MLYDFGEKALGDGYKFADYYLSFGIPDKPLKLYESNSYPTVDDIIRDYQIDGKAVEEKKEQIFKAFPRQIIMCDEQVLSFSFTTFQLDHRCMWRNCLKAIDMECQ